MQQESKMGVQRRSGQSGLGVCGVTLLVWAAAATTASAATTTVDDAGTARDGKVGAWSSLVAGGGDAAIAYYCESDPTGPAPAVYSLRFAWKSGGAWQWTNLYNGVGGYACMARGSDGVYHILTQAPGGILWLYGTLDNWNYGDFLTTASPAQQITMALDSQNRPHIAYMTYTDAGDYALLYNYWDGVQWVGGATQNVAGGLWWGGANCPDRYIALDAADTPYLVYAFMEGEIKLASLQAGLWAEEGVGLGTHPTLALDATGQPHLAYNQLSQTEPIQLVYARKSGEIWVTEPITPPGEAGNAPSIALSASGAPYVAYSSAGTEDLRLAIRGSAGWTTTQLDGDGSASGDQVLGRHGISMNIDENQQAHVSYEATNFYTVNNLPEFRSDLRYATFGPGDAVPTMSFWGLVVMSLAFATIGTLIHRPRAAEPARA